MELNATQLKSRLQQLEVMIRLTKKYLETSNSVVMEDQLDRLEVQHKDMSLELSLIPLQEFFNQPIKKSKKKKNVKKRR